MSVHENIIFKPPPPLC